MTFFFEQGMQEESNSSSLGHGFKVGKKVVKLNPLKIHYDPLNLNNGGTLGTHDDWQGDEKNKAEIVMTTLGSYQTRNNWVLLQRNMFRGIVKLEGYVTDEAGQKHEFDSLFGVIELFSYRG